MAAVFENAVAAESADVWESIARGYAAFASPMVPCDEDILAYEKAVARHAQLADSGSVEAIMLGVTPSVAQMRWPAGARVTAFEISPAVIRAIWPGDVPGVREARCASWFALPRARRSCDVIVGDGVTNVCRFPNDVRVLSHVLSDLLKEGGTLVVRSYVRPPVPETVDAVFEALFGSNGLRVDSFKMRLYMAMQRSPEEGVAVRDAIRVLDRYDLDGHAMRIRCGWSSAAVEPFSRWRGSDAIYSFPTLDELREVLHERFEEISVAYPGYELGHCCPTLAMRVKEKA